MADDLFGSESDRGSGPGSNASGSYAGSAPGSPAGSARSSSPGSGPPSTPGSPGGQRSRSGSPASHSGSEHSRSRSSSPAGSQRSRSGSGSRSNASSRSRSRSRSGSRSGSSAHSGSGRSRSPSPHGSHGSATPHGSRSPTPQGSRSPSPHGSRSPSPHGSRSPSPHGSRSASPSGSERSVASPGSVHTPGQESDARAKSGSEDEAKRDVEEDMDTTAVDHATADDLFGDAGDITSDSEDEAKPRDEREDEREAVPVIQEEEEEEEVPETRIEVEIPKINTALGKNLYFVKLPNFLSVETRPFDPQVYEDEIDEDEVMDEEGRTRLKLKVENTIRWRTMKDDDGNDVLDEFGEPVRESNARYVRWSDGSMSMHLGNEIFDVHPMTLQGDFNHLFIRQGTGLQGQAVFKTKLTFRPHSTDSFTHRKMTMSMVDRSSKTQKVKVLPIAGKDPESQRSEMIKKEEERLRASIRRESQQRRIRERAHQRGLNPNYLEDDDDENGISLSAIKHKYKQSAKGGHRPNIYSSSSEDSSSDEEANRKRLLKAKKLDSDEESDGSDGEVKRKKAKVAASSDDEDSGDGAGKSGSGSGSGGSRSGSAASGSDSD